MVVLFFCVVSLEVAVVQAVCFFDSVASFLGCDLSSLSGVVCFYFWGMLGAGLSFVVPGVIFEVTSSIVQVLFINCWVRVVV